MTFEKLKWNFQGHSPLSAKDLIRPVSELREFINFEGRREMIETQLKSLFKNVTWETTTMRLDNSESCILFKEELYKNQMFGLCCCGVLELIVHISGCLCRHNLVPIQESINSTNCTSVWTQVWANRERESFKN